MRKLITLLALIFVLPSMAEDIYRWVDDTGQVHYTDVPQESADAVEINVPPAQTFTMPTSAAPPADELTAVESEESDGVAYQSIDIASPTAEETVWNTGGKVTATVSLQPDLRRGDKVRVYLDGIMVDDLSQGQMNLTLTDVSRGEHALRAEVLSESGSVLIRSKSSTFFYQQTSVDRRPNNGSRAR